VSGVSALDSSNDPAQPVNPSANASSSASLERVVVGNEAALSGLAGSGAAELQQLVFDVRDASAEVRALARALRENPSSLLRESKEQGVEIAK